MVFICSPNAAAGTGLWDAGSRVESPICQYPSLLKACPWSNSLYRTVLPVYTALWLVLRLEVELYGAHVAMDGTRAVLCVLGVRWEAS